MLSRLRIRKPTIKEGSYSGQVSDLDEVAFVRLRHAGEPTCFIGRRVIELASGAMSRLWKCVAV